MEFICRDPNAQVRAANVRSTLDAFKLQPLYAKTLIEPFGLKLEEMTADRFVPVQRWLDAMKHLRDELGPFVLRQVGTAIIENADFPPQLDTVEAVLRALDNIYYANHRGDVGHYHVNTEADGAVTVRCETPYPAQFERGLIEGISRNPRLTKGRHYAVRYVEGPPGGNVTCTLVVQPLTQAQAQPLTGSKKAV